MDETATCECAPADVTPAMIEAGMEEFWQHDVEDEGSRLVLTNVFVAMALAGGWSPPEPRVRSPG